VNAPCIFLIDEAKGRLYMERILGVSLKQWLHDHYDPSTETYDPRAKDLAYQMGVAIARMHDADIVHGDLTTSNLMKRNDVPNTTATNIVVCYIYI
jgi:TP53 regulating kinase-like protein